MGVDLSNLDTAALRDLCVELATAGGGAAFEGRRAAGASLGRDTPVTALCATDGQLQYEWRWLMRKLRLRSPDVYRRHLGVGSPAAHPLFRIVSGPVADWEHERT